MVHLFRLADGSPAGPPSGERDQAGLDELQVAEVVKDLLAAAPAPGAERLALAGFLAGYRGLTREAYTLDLRQFSS